MGILLSRNMHLAPKKQTEGSWSSFEASFLIREPSRQLHPLGTSHYKIQCAMRETEIEGSWSSLEVGFQHYVDLSIVRLCLLSLWVHSYAVIIPRRTATIALPT